ncbi:uncharacterized protein CXorf49-like isoform X1 [Dipodomys merriami]|uniref:uncharacterized protein CXorf49-like isoform X1 n=1 Tax=Dipodomys merriami TaxID=94247 RepID=UPI003855AE06
MFGRGRGRGPEGGKRSGVYRIGRRTIMASGLTRESGLPQITRGLIRDPEPPQVDRGLPRIDGGLPQIGLPGPQVSDYNSESELEVIFSGGVEFQGGRDSSSFAEDRGGAKSPLFNFSAEDTGKQHPAFQVAGSQLRFPTWESVSAILSASWAEAAPPHRGRGTLVPRERTTMVPSHVGAEQASATLPQPSRPKTPRAWRERERGREVSRMFSQKDQWSSSDTDTSEEFSRRPRTRRSRRMNHRSQVYSDSPKESESTTGSSCDENEAIFYPVPGDFLPSSPQKVKTIKEKQRGLEETSCRIKQNVIREFSGAAAVVVAAAAAAATAGGMLRGNPTKKMTMEKKIPEGPLRVTLGRNTPSWRQIRKTPPPEAAALPPILGIPPSGGSKAPSTLHPGPKRYKQGNTLKKCGAWKRRKSCPVAREDDEANRGPGLLVQLPKCRPDLPNFCKHGGEFNNVEHHIGDSHDEMDLQPFPQIQGDIMPKGRANSDDQEPPMYYRDTEMPQQSSGEQGCSRCLMVHSDIEKLKEQLAAIQSLTEKFQSLGI